MTSTYVSGPVYGRATQFHYKSMQWVYQDMKDNQRQDYCVLSEHFGLASLDAISGGSIKNGNFPMEYGYLEESGKIFVQMFSGPNLHWMDEAVKLSGSPGCYLVIEPRFLAEWNKIQIRWILGKEVERIDGVHIWLYDT